LTSIDRKIAFPRTEDIKKRFQDIKKETLPILRPISIDVTSWKCHVKKGPKVCINGENGGEFKPVTFFIQGSKRNGKRL